jgi:hypothetical protein
VNQGSNNFRKQEKFLENSNRPLEISREKSINTKFRLKQNNNPY